MALSSRDERRLTSALKVLAEFWPHLVIPRGERAEDLLLGVAMFRDIEGAIRIRTALDEHIRGSTS